MSFSFQRIAFYLIGFFVFPHAISVAQPVIEKPNRPDHHQDRIWDIQFASFEAETNGLLTIELAAKAAHPDSRLFVPMLLLGKQSEWLSSWSVQVSSGEGIRAKAGATDTVRFQLQYDPKNLPYTYRRVQLGLRDQTGQLQEMVSAFIYFTPYGVTEVWNAYDFDSLNRHWDSMHQPHPQRLHWDLNQLAKREWDLIQAGRSGQSVLSSSKPRKTLSLPGLAYAVPVEDGRVEKTRAKKLDFFGTIEGEIVADINGSDLNIVDIAVQVWEVDLINGDALLATGFTDDDGQFSVDFFTSGGGLPTRDIYVVVASYNHSDLIRVRTRLGAIRTETFFRNAPAVFDAGIDRTHDFGRIEMDTNLAKPQLLHWANRSRQFVDSNLPGVLPDQASDRLDIMLSFSGSNQAYFFPGGYKWDIIFVSALVFGQVAPIAAAVVGGIGLIFISDHDGIYFGEDRETTENVAYHEFGHYLMWHLQSESWIDILEASFAVHFATSNNPNPKITWTEGFANGFSGIVDTWSQADDGEFGNDNIGDYEARTSGGFAVENWPGLDHGFYSEWNVGCALYDLWDGPSQVLQDGTTLANAADYDDSGLDQVALSFADMMLPLQNNAGTGGFHMQVGVFGVVLGNDQEQHLLTNIVEYHAALMSVLESDCNARRDVTDLMNDDSVNNFSPTSFLDEDLLSSDLLAFNRDIVMGANVSTFSVDVTELRNDLDEFNLANLFTSPLTLALSDDLLVSGQIGGSATLFFNGSRTYGWQDPGNSYGQIWLPGFPPGETLDVDLCGNMTLEVREGGTLMVGEPGAPPATVRLKAGSTLILGGDHQGAVLAQESTYNTFVSMGTLEINPGSRFIVEAGATLIYNRGGNILLNGNTSVLEIYGDIIVSEAANFKPQGDGEVIFGLPDLGGNPNVTVNNLSVIQFLELDVRLIADTYFRPYDNATVRFLMEFGTAGMGAESYIHAGIGPLVMRHMDYFSTDGGFHRGVWVNQALHDISDIVVQGGAPGLWGQSLTSPLSVSHSTVYACETGILAEAGGVGFEHGVIAHCSSAGIESIGGIVTAEDVIFDSNYQAILSYGGGGSLLDVTVRDGDIGWRADDPSADINIERSTFSNHLSYGMHVNSYTAVVTLNDVTMDFNQVGLRAEGPMRVEPYCSEFIDNVDVAIEMVSNAHLDMSNNAYNTISGSDINLYLEGAAAPTLIDGHNLWTTADAGDFNILGTIVLGTCVCTPGVDGLGNPICADPWSFSDITGDLSFFHNTFTTPVLSERIEIFDAATNECAYVPLTSAAVNICPLP